MRSGSRQAGSERDRRAHPQPAAAPGPLLRAAAALGPGAGPAAALGSGAGPAAALRSCSLRGFCAALPAACFRGRGGGAGAQPRSPLPRGDSAVISSGLASAGYFRKGCRIIQWLRPAGRGRSSAARPPLQPLPTARWAVSPRFLSPESCAKRWSCLCYQSVSRKYRKRVMFALRESCSCTDINSQDVNVDLRCPLGQGLGVVCPRPQVPRDSVSEALNCGSGHLGPVLSCFDFPRDLGPSHSCTLKLEQPWCCACCPQDGVCESTGQCWCCACCPGDGVRCPGASGPCNADQ